MTIGNLNTSEWNDYVTCLRNTVKWLQHPQHHERRALVAACEGVSSVEELIGKIATLSNANFLQTRLNALVKNRAALMHGIIAEGCANEVASELDMLRRQEIAVLQSDLNSVDELISVLKTELENLMSSDEVRASELSLFGANHSDVAVLSSSPTDRGITLYDIDSTLTNTARPHVGLLLNALYHSSSIRPEVSKNESERLLDKIFAQVLCGHTFGEYDLCQFVQLITSVTVNEDDVRLFMRRALRKHVGAQNVRSSDVVRLTDKSVPIRIDDFVQRKVAVINDHFAQIMSKVDHLVVTGLQEGRFSRVFNDERRLQIRGLLIGGIDIDMAIDLVFGEGPIGLITHREADMMHDKLSQGRGIFPTGAVIDLIRRLVPERPFYYVSTVQDYVTYGLDWRAINAPNADYIATLICQKPGMGIEAVRQVETHLESYQASLQYSHQDPNEREGQDVRIAELKATIAPSLYLFRDVMSRNKYARGGAYESKELQILHLAWYHYIQTGEVPSLTHYDDRQEYLRIGRIAQLLPPGSSVKGMHCPAEDGMLPREVSHVTGPSRDPSPVIEAPSPTIEVPSPAIEAPGPIANVMEDPFTDDESDDEDVSDLICPR